MTKIQYENLTIRQAEVKGLQQQIHEQEQQAENIEQFVQRVKRNSTLTALFMPVLRPTVSRISRIVA